MLQTFLPCGFGWRLFTGGDDSYYFASGFPFNAITRLDVEAVCDRFWDAHLELACYLTHILTIPRKLSLLSSEFAAAC
jgi:hypothetical protein